MPRIAMVNPSGYGVQYEINAWMKIANQPDLMAANAQWQALHDKIQELGTEVTVLEPAPNAPDHVFVANAGLGAVLPDGRKIFVPSEFAHAERAPEVPTYVAQAKNTGGEVVTIQDLNNGQPLDFEGEGDALFLRGAGGSYLPKLFIGYGFRTDIKTHQLLGNLFGVETISLELTDPYFYHLDTCFFTAPNGVIGYYPDAFSENSRKLIELHFPQDKRLVVTPEFAHEFGCNAVVATPTDIIISSGAPKETAFLQAAGLNVHVLPATQFYKAGGSLKCMTYYADKEIQK